jgi:putative ABC transport system permease protein
MSSRPVPDLARRRSASSHTSMFLRMLWRAAVLRRGRAASAMLAMVVAAAVATAMLNLFVDVQAKLGKEFRNYGANLVVVAKGGKALPANALTAVNSTLAGHGLAVPFAYVVARTPDGQPVVVSGTDFEQVRKLNSWWSVTAWPEDSGVTSDVQDESTYKEAAKRRKNAAHGASRGLEAEHHEAPTGRKNSPAAALLGVRAASVVSPRGQPFDLNFQGRTLHLTPAGTLQTGAAEDSRVYISLRDFETWTGILPSVIEIAASGSPEEVGVTIHNLEQALPASEVRPIRQIVEGEARVLGKTRATLLAAATLIILTAALCVLSTLIGWVFDRRRDFAIMKALGASGRLMSGFLAAEAAALGAVGSVIGFAIGIGVAVWIGRVNFHAPVAPRFGVLPVILGGSVAVALISAVIPILLLQRVQPATILRGE